MVFNCSEDGCQATFTRKYNLDKHFQRYHTGNLPVEKCFLCGQIFNNCEDLSRHFQTYHKPTRKFVLVESAFKKAITNYRYQFPENSGELNFFQSQLSIKNLIRNTIVGEAARKTICKVSLVFTAQMSMMDLAGNKISTQYIPFRSPAFNANASNSGSITKNISRSFNYQAEALENFINSGSNWHFDRAFTFNIEMSCLRPVVTGDDEDFGEINITSIQNNSELFNPSGTKNKCFLYCIAQHLYGSKKPRGKKTVRQFLKKHVNNFNTAGIDFPISIKHIEKFLKINQELDLKVNILYQKTNGDIFPLEFGLGKGEKIVNLLMVQRKENSLSAVNHFLLIKNVDHFLRKTYQDQKNKKQYQNAHFCLNCLNHFYTKKTLLEHQNLCSLNKPRIERIPENCEIKFKNFENSQPLDLVAYLDFECILPNVQSVCKVCDKIKCTCDASYTDILTKQKAIGYSFVVLNKDQIIHEKSYLGDKANEHFIEHLLEEENRWIKNYLSTSKPMVISSGEEVNFLEATNCYMCDIYFGKDVVKCRDHSHQTSQYLGAACQSCNLRRQRPRRLKIFAHNGSR